MLKKRVWNFTLLELLIVIAIILILASLLLPSLNSARKKAMGMQCLSNVKGLGLSCQQYTSDNDDAVMPTIHSPNRGVWQQRLLPYYLRGGEYSVSDASGWKNNGVFSVQKGRIPFILKVFACALDKGTYLNGTTRDTVATMKSLLEWQYYDAWNGTRPSSYGTNGYAGYESLPVGYHPKWFGKISKVKNPSSKIYMGEAVCSGGTSLLGAATEILIQMTRHTGVLNYAFMDGHIGALSVQSSSSEWTSRYLDLSR